MNEVYDGIVIGSGPAGSTTAKKLAEKGWKIAVVEEDRFGGTCPLKGCVPKKILAAVAEMRTRISRYEEAGLIAESRIDWPKLQAFKRRFIEPVPFQKERDLQHSGITTYRGHAAFAGQQTVEVNGHILFAKRILIATGAKPLELPIEGREHIRYSDDFLDLPELPRRIMFIGGGYISFEFAHIAASCGSEVHILQRGPSVLEGFDEELVQRLVVESEKIGIQVHLQAAAKTVVQHEKGYTVRTDCNGVSQEFEADLVVAAAGRKPNLEGLALEKAHVKYDKQGIAVNPFMQSVSNPHVYAAGDVAGNGSPQLMPIAHLDADAVVYNWLNGNEQIPDYRPVPSVVFTTPKLASVGLSVNEAAEAGHSVDVLDLDISEWFTYRLGGEKNAKAKMILDRNEGHILGAHIVSDEADQLINLFGLCCQLKLNVKDLQQLAFAFPTPGSDLPAFLQ